MPAQHGTRSRKVRSDASMMRVSGVILAAGSSVRMGQPKQLLRVGDRTLLDLVIAAALGSRLSEVVVVLGASAEQVRSSVRTEETERLRIVVNGAHARGVSTSLRCGVAACDPRSEGAAILLADQPSIDSGRIDSMLDAFAARGARIVRPVFHRHDGAAVPGHPVLLARSVWPLLDTLEGDEGARALIARNPELLETVDVRGDEPEDVDTMDDYRRVCTTVSVER